MKIPALNSSKHLVHQWVLKNAAELRDNKVRSGNTKGLNGLPRSPEQIFKHAQTGFAAEIAVFEMFTEFGKDLGWVVQQSKVRTHDIELTVNGKKYLIDVKTLSNPFGMRSMTLGEFEMNRADRDTIYLVFDGSNNEEFYGWTTRADFQPSFKKNGTGFVYMDDLNDEESLPF